MNLATESNANVDDKKGLERPPNEPCDGKTIPEDFGSSTPTMRKNKGTTIMSATGCNLDPENPNKACTPNKPCQYIYFNVDDKFMSADNTHPNVDVVVTYYDYKPVTDWATHFCLKYKTQGGSPVSICLSTPINGSNTMKTFTFALNNAFFGNTVANNTDFRIECRTDASGNLIGNKDTRRWIDTVKVVKK